MSEFVEQKKAERKKIIRADMRRTRKALSAELRTSETTACAQTLLTYLSQRSCTDIASYLAAGSELDLDRVHEHLWQSGQRVWLPRVVGPGELSWHPLAGPGHFLSGDFGIREPDPDHHPAETLPADILIIVPGLAFAADGHRLGQGQGFYDRALESHRGPAIGLGFTCQRCDDLPCEAHDRRLDGIILGGQTLLLPP